MSTVQTNKDKRQYILSAYMKVWNIYDIEKKHQSYKNNYLYSSEVLLWKICTVYSVQCSFVKQVLLWGKGKHIQLHMYM